MSEFDFKGRTAIVTGAGGNPSLGRAHAMLLAARGANVVVNDIGETQAPNYQGVASAEAVAEEIRSLGGSAVADTHSVATEEGAQAVIQTAVDAFGGVDILVNNAGVSLAVPFDVMSSRDTQLHVDVNLLGTIWMCRAAWPHMRKKGYGRIVNTGSGSFAGMWGQATYGATKGGVFSFTRGLASEGEEFGIKANTVNPGGFTRMLKAQQYESSPMYKHVKEHLPAELASPLVAFLAHKSCPVSGECFDSMGGDVRRVYIAHTDGISDKRLSIETVAERWGEIMGAPQDKVLEAGFVDSENWHVLPYKGEPTPA